MSRPTLPTTRLIGAIALLALAALAPSPIHAAPAPVRPAGPAPVPGPAPEPSPEPASTFVGHLYSSASSQGTPDIDFGVITSIRYSFSSLNQGISILASKDGKTNLCFIQFHATAMSTNRPGWTRAEPLETYREIVAAARTPGGRILCIVPPSQGPGSIARVGYTGSFAWLTLGTNINHEFQIIYN